MDQEVKDAEKEIALAIVAEIHSAGMDKSLDDFEYMEKVHELIRCVVKGFKYAENKSIVVMSKPFTDMIEKCGYILDTDYEHPTKGTWESWRRARIAKTK